MADIHPSLQIDDDWKRQAQEEKRKLAEAEAAKKAQAVSTAAVAPVGGIGGVGGMEGGRAVGAGGGAAGGARGRRGAGGEAPPASFSTLVQTVMTQALFYLGELGTRSGQTMVDLDLAKNQVDLLGVLEEKTKGNLSAEEQRLLDSALYETRMRFVGVAREYAELGTR